MQTQSNFSYPGFSVKSAAKNKPRLVKKSSKRRNLINYLDSVYLAATPDRSTVNC